MPYKDQSLCYRTIGGVKYVNWCDVLGEEEEKIMAGVKARKLPHRIVKHKDGFVQLFVSATVSETVIDEILKRG